MRIFLTGSTGFIGSRLAASLRGRGDDVVALVRSPTKAGSLIALGCEIVVGDLSDIEVTMLEGCDALVHSAAIYQVGVSTSKAEAMRDVNVGGTERTLDAAVSAGVGRLVYVSTVNTFGDTKGAVVDETYLRPAGSFVSAYDETKWFAHEAATRRIEAGAPIMIAMPGLVYGPGDTSQMGEQIRSAMAGKLPYVGFPTLGVSAVHVDDVVEGIVLLLDRGEIGEAYVLGGELTHVRDLIGAAAHAAGTRAPRFTMPTWAIRLTAPLGRTGVGPMLGIPANVRELIAAADGVTYWATDAKARTALGYSPRTLATGMAETLRDGA
ncbi:NAD-dependent epimerase/dehydratase family protein [Gaiella sp.]|uniref:NAD-dependent epimerase/dehydratase family protein n=1 Tax=Gaiella sp. TaxID=2663207 RepID=UPI0032635F2D